MARKFSPQIITANDLFEGDVVYLTQAGAWARSMIEAHVAHSPEQVETMLKVANEQQDKIVGAYATNVAVDEAGNPKPAHFRETFRTRGPSNYFHGKQADDASQQQKLVA